MSMQKKLQQSEQRGIEKGMQWMASWWEQALDETKGIGPATKTKIMETVRAKAAAAAKRNGGTHNDTRAQNMDRTLPGRHAPGSEATQDG